MPVFNVCEKCVQIEKGQVDIYLGLFFQNYNVYRHTNVAKEKLYKRTLRCQHSL